MTPTQRAIKCTAIGGLSGLPKWEYLPGFQLFVAYIDRTEQFRLQGENEDLDFRSAMLFCDDVVIGPDFSDELTLHGLLFLVRRAWAGYRVDVAFKPSGLIDLHITGSTPLGHPYLSAVPLWLEDVTMEEGLVQALEAAP